MAKGRVGLLKPERQQAQGSLPPAAANSSPTCQRRAGFDAGGSKGRAQGTRELASGQLPTPGLRPAALGCHTMALVRHFACKAGVRPCRSLADEGEGDDGQNGQQVHNALLRRVAQHVGGGQPVEVCRGRRDHSTPRPCQGRNSYARQVALARCARRQPSACCSRRREFSEGSKAAHSRCRFCDRGKAPQTHLQSCPCQWRWR